MKDQQAFQTGGIGFFDGGYIPTRPLQQFQIIFLLENQYTDRKGGSMGSNIGSSLQFRIIRLKSISSSKQKMMVVPVIIREWSL